MSILDEIGYNTEEDMYTDDIAIITLNNDDTLEQKTMKAECFELDSTLVQHKAKENTAYIETDEDSFHYNPFEQDQDSLKNPHETSQTTCFERNPGRIKTKPGDKGTRLPRNREKLEITKRNPKSNRNNKYQENFHKRNNHMQANRSSCADNLNDTHNFSMHKRDYRVYDNRRFNQDYGAYNQSFNQDQESHNRSFNGDQGDYNRSFPHEHAGQDTQNYAEANQRCFNENENYQQQRYPSNDPRRLDNDNRIEFDTGGHSFNHQSFNPHVKRVSYYDKINNQRRRSYNYAAPYKKPTPTHQLPLTGIIE